MNTCKFSEVEISDDTFSSIVTIESKEGKNYVFDCNYSINSNSFHLLHGRYSDGSKADPDELREVVLANLFIVRDEIKDYISHSCRSSQ